jgi:hypothetical protein
MIVRGFGVFFTLLLGTCLFAGPVYAQAPAWLAEADNDSRSPYGISLKLRKYVNSFTSYEFPNPFPPNQDPLSRLEFPIDQWFLGLGVDYSAPHWSVAVDGWVNLSRSSDRSMQDSDWDDETMPFQKTIFSESSCRMDRGLMLDLAFTVGKPMGRGFGVRPVFGYRHQYFDFTTHDGVQEDISGNTANLQGDGIEFEQTYHHYFAGAQVGLDLQRLGRVSLGRLQATCQIDYALVDARNEDLHLLRSGERITIENGSGHCWHFGIAVTSRTSRSIRAGVSIDFMRVITDGSHRLLNSPFSIDFSFDGSKAWSDQLSGELTAEIVF